MLDALETLLNSISSEWIAAILLFVLPFIREDVASAIGGLLIVEGHLPYWTAFASLYAGIVASDFTLFGLGRLARRSARLRRLLLHPRLERVGNWLLGHVPEAMIVARVVPGVILPVYVGCGLLGVRAMVFGPITMLTAAFYLPAILLLVIRFGEGALSGSGYWAWMLAIAAFLLVMSSWARNPPWGVLLRVGRSGVSGLFSWTKAPLKVPRISHVGMPSLRGLATHVALAERIPTKLFYFPLAVQWVWLSIRYRSLSLPALVNPRIEVGGLWGESKQVYLDMVSGESRVWLAPYVTLPREDEDALADGRRALEAARQAGLAFPLVAKPDIGWQGYGVRPVASAEDLMDYVAAFPLGARMMLQEMVPWEGEAGVFYIREPGEETGRVIALTFRYFPHVVGDGTQTVRDLILADQRAAWKAGAHLGLETKHAGLTTEFLGQVPAPGEIVRLAFIGSIRVGGLYRDESGLITPALSARFDAISRSMPDFYYGRYDIRFASAERLQQGEDFRIIEINGAGGESISAWDPDTPLREVYGRLFAHQRMLFEIGARNRARGFRPPGPLAILRAAWRQTRLVNRYPASL
jgi:membrane protein DedA with SNARE-associated domain